MFWDKQTTTTDREDLLRSMRDKEHENSLKIITIEKKHELQLKEKEFELKHFKDDEIKSLQTKIYDLQEKNAVLLKENEMLGKITNLNADIIDIKDLVASLISKLPEIKLNNLTISNGDSKK